MKPRILAGLAACLISPALASPAAPPAASETEAADGFRQMEELVRVMETVRAQYVDPGKVAWPRLMAGALRGMLEELDPHCQYLSPEVYARLKESPEAGSDGAGFTLAPRGDGLVVVSVREDGPAARAGLMPGDHVLRLGETPVGRLTWLEAMQLLRGAPGEPVALAVSRPGTGESLAFSFVREAERRETVRDAMLLDPLLAGDAKLGYLRLTQFASGTPTELADALDRLEERGMQALILDLRNNPGGLLTATVECCGEFLPASTAVVTTESRAGTGSPAVFKTPSRKRRERGYPVAVLVNHASASGAELMAAALQDLGRAVIAGTTTFGKGSVQSILPVGSGTAIRLTTALYFTPKHRPIHGKGVVPDISLPLTAAQEAALMAYWRTASTADADPAKLARAGDLQLERAAVALRGVLALRRLPAR